MGSTRAKKLSVILINNPRTENKCSKRLHAKVKTAVSRIEFFMNLIFFSMYKTTTSESITKERKKIETIFDIFRGDRCVIVIEMNLSNFSGSMGSCCLSTIIF